jgi:hypothetical protein
MRKESSLLSNLKIAFTSILGPVSIFGPVSFFLKVESKKKIDE